MDLPTPLNSPSRDFLDDEIKEELPFDVTSDSDPITAVFISSPCELSGEFNNEILMQLCRSCLSNTNVQVSESISTAYTEATGVLLSDERLPSNLCHRCIAYVRKFHRFRNACLNTDTMLKSMVDKEMLNKISIRKIQKDYENLFMNLSVTRFLPNHYTLSIIQDDCYVKSENIDWKDDILRNDYDGTSDNDNRSDIDRKSDNDNLIFDQDVDVKINRSEGVVSKTRSRQQKKAVKKRKKITRNSSKNDGKIAPFVKEIIENLNDDNEMKKNKVTDSIIDKSLQESDDDQPLIILNKKQLKTKECLKKPSEKRTIDNRTMKRQDSSFEEFFSIEILSLDQQKEEFEKRKLTENYKNSKLKCDLCFKGFLHDSTLSLHMAKHTKSMGEFTCAVCHKHCASHKAWRLHVDAFHKYKYTCKQCDFETKTRCTARLHIDYHNGKKYKCEMCNQEFTRQSSLMSHRRVKHATDAVCALCGYSYLGDKGLLFHRNFKHKLDDLNVPPDGPICTDCDIIFANEDALATHNKVSPRHGICSRNQPPAAPPKKKKNAQDRPRLIKRINKDVAASDESNEGVSQKVNCEQCGLVVSSRKEYCVHFNRAHPSSSRTMFPRGSATRLCALCGKHFQNASMLSNHMTTAHSKGPYKHKCAQCGKTFAQRGNLTVHMNIHLGRRFPCPVCGKMFNQTFNRDRHYTYVHSAVKDIKCDYCDKYFKSDNEKKLHTNYVHFKKPYLKRSRGRKQTDCLPPRKKRREDFGGTEWNGDCDSQDVI